MKDQRQPTSTERTERAFARRMRELREERGLSQVRLAEELGRVGLKLDDMAILRMEKGARRIRLGEAATIARVLGVRLDEMLRRTEPLEDEFSNVRKELEMATRHRDALRGSLVAADTKVEDLMWRMSTIEDAIAESFLESASSIEGRSPGKRADQEGVAEILGSFESYGEQFTMVRTPDGLVIAASDEEMAHFDRTGRWPDTVMTRSWERMTRSHEELPQPPALHTGSSANERDYAEAYSLAQDAIKRAHQAQRIYDERKTKDAEAYLRAAVEDRDQAFRLAWGIARDLNLIPGQSGQRRAIEPKLRHTAAKDE